jgi:hypothetical protein
MREHGVDDMNFITAPYADTSANQSGWGEIGDGYSGLQRDPRHWGGQIRYIPVTVAKTEIDTDEDARDKAA